MGTHAQRTGILYPSDSQTRPATPAAPTLGPLSYAHCAQTNTRKTKQKHNLLANRKVCHAARPRRAPVRTLGLKVTNLENDQGWGTRACQS